MSGSTIHPIVAVSPFGTGPVIDHTFDDDEFYFDYLIARGEQFTFHAPRFSAKRLIARRPAYAEHVVEMPDFEPSWRHCVNMVRNIKVVGGARVVFFGFTEKLVLAFVLARPFVRFTLTLVATNNFSSRRARSYGPMLRGFLWGVGPRVNRLVVHTEYERDLVQRLAWPARPDVRVKKHHLMLHHRPVPDFSALVARPTIAFFGPSKFEKPLAPALDLIQADVHRKYNYRLVGLAAADIAAIRAIFGSDPAIELQGGMLPRSEYLSVFAASSLVLLTHTRDFEGKLSGNLCDSIANAVPFLGNTIEPHFEYLRRFGRIGFVEDMASGRDWACKFLASVQLSDIVEAQEALRCAASEFSLASVSADLDAVI